jgi:ribosomal protein S12 methylthiotransferase accessory factor YcaO
MDHLEVVKLMEQSGGKVWEEGRVSHRHTAVAVAEAVAEAATAQPGNSSSCNRDIGRSSSHGSHGMNSSRTSSNGQKTAE